MVRKLLAALIGVLLAASMITASGTGAQATGSHRTLRPIVFVHGYSGSGGQFETPARRFASNGYPAASIDVLEYDSTFVVAPLVQVQANLQAKIEAILARTGASQVDLVGHSLGTAVSQEYLNSSPQRAAQVAHYVNIDGRSAAALPGGVPTLAIWAQLNPQGTIPGAQDLRLPGQGHTEAVSSPESFSAMYRFFTGREPRTTRIVPQFPGQVQLSGRALLFPSNVGVSNARLDVYRVSAKTGQRLGARFSHGPAKPVASFALSGDGSWGPFRASGSAHYEFAIVRGEQTHHVYFEPFRRTDRLIRLLTSEPGQGLDGITDKSDRSSNLILTRYKEWWSDQGEASDTLTVNGQSVLDGIAPRSKLAIALFTFDAGSDGVSHLGVPIPVLASLPFLTGVDLFLPSFQPAAAGTPRGTISLVSQQRASGGTTHRVNVPNWPSATDRISVQFDDYGQPRR